MQWKENSRACAGLMEKVDPSHFFIAADSFRDKIPLGLGAWFNNILGINDVLCGVTSMSRGLARQWLLWNCNSMHNLNGYHPLSLLCCFFRVQNRPRYTCQPPNHPQLENVSIFYDSHIVHGLFISSIFPSS